MRASGSLASVRRGVAVLVATVLLALGACGGPEPVYVWREGAIVSFEVRAREELLPGRSGREIRIVAQGRVEAGPALDLEILSVRHERLREGGAVAVVDTGTAAASPGDRAPEDVAMARLAEGLVGRRFRLPFDPVTGLAEVVGLDAALDAAPAGDAAAEDARDGLRVLLDADPLRRGLRAAGLCELPPGFHERNALVERTIDVRAPGAGIVPCRLFGEKGEEGDGSPVVKWKGRVRGDAVPTGAPGRAPPAEVGPVRLAAIEAEGQTLHDLASSAPLRGRIEVRLPYEGGATVVTTTSFLLAVRP